LHISLLKQNPNVVLDRVYYHRTPPPGYSHLPLTNDLSECLDSDVIIVSSPTSVHFDHIQALRDYGGYVFLEKPAVNTTYHMEELRKLPASLKSRMRVNFNFAYHDFGVLASNLMQSGELGDVFAFDVHTSHGVAFRKDWDNTWRIQGTTGLGPLETTGIHYVQFCIREFGRCINRDIHTRCLSGRPGTIDTGILNMTMETGTWARVRHSYAAPYATRFELWGSDGYLLYDGRVASLHHPRDTFDGDGLYTSPPVQSCWKIDFKQAWSESLRRAQEDFVNVARQGVLLDPSEFERDVSVMAVLLQDHK
jgi:predicted dehydrogenase